MRKQIHDGEADILIGTQMLAKGHDFPNLTLVGVISPDGALYSADFRASEKLFAQLTQVGGRAGRADKAGEVIVQTAFPNHPLFQALRAHDYEIWAQTLLAERQMAGFPPFVYQALLSAEGKQESDAYNFLKQARTARNGIAHAGRSVRRRPRRHAQTRQPLPRATAGAERQAQGAGGIFAGVEADAGCVACEQIAVGAGC